MAPADLSPALREHLAVTYDLLRLLGEGGMGVVWLGRDRLLDREVAIKVLRRDPTGDQDTARRFLQEARLAARLQHPGIVPLLTFGEVGDERFYVMPFVRGETLADRMRRGLVPEPELRRIVAEVADALAYVHEREIVHRDVKPANILLDAESGRAVLTDFGIARIRDATTVTGTGLVVGTPRYLAPEQASGGLDVVDGRADIYALGLVAWEAATGEPAFGDVSANELLARKLTGALEDPRKRRPELSAALAIAIQSAAATDVEQRFSSAASFANAMRPGAVSDADPLQPLDSTLSVYALASVPASALVTAGLLSEQMTLGLGARALIGTAIGTGICALMGAARLQGLRQEFAPKAPWREAIRRACTPPVWWFAWWPKRWRSFYLPDHLPPEAARVARRQVATVSWMLALGALYQLPLLLLGVASDSVLVQVDLGAVFRAMRPITLAAPVAALAALLYIVVPSARLQSRWKRAGLEVRPLRRLLGQLYNPAALANPALNELHEFERANAVPTTLLALGEAVDAAENRARVAGWELSDVRSAVQRLIELDRGWAENERALASEVEDGEAARAREHAERLRTLTIQTAAQRQMLALLDSQLQLVAASENALRHLRARRARALDLLQSLWLQLRALTMTSASGKEDSAIRAIADDLQRLLDESAHP